MNKWRVATAVGLGLVLALSPAIAATQPAVAGPLGYVQVSNDGVAYGAALVSPVFTPSPVLVPLQSASASFWVRNAGPDAAYLLLTLDDSSWGSWDYASGLSLSAAVPGRAGAAVPLSATPACTVLLAGVALGAGGSVEVTLTLALGDKDGASGQTSWASIDMGVALTQAAGLGAPTDCSTPVTPVVVVPAPSPASGTVAPTTDAEVVVPGDGDSEPNPVPFPDPDNVLEVLTNTLASFNTDMLSVASASVPLGAGLFLLVGFGRRARDKFREVDES